MNAVIHPLSHSGRPNPGRQGQNPSQENIEAAFRTFLHWIGEDPDRDGLRETPARVARAFQEYFCGYGQDPEQILQKTFEETDGYDEMVVLKGIPFQSHCEHHVAPIIGRAWVAYVPNARVVGISKLARVVEAYAKRLHTDPGASDCSDRQHDRARAEAQGRRGRHQGNPPLHDHSWHQQARRRSSHQSHAGMFPGDPLTRQEFLSMVHSNHDQ